MNEFKIGIVGGAGYIGSTLANSLSKTFKVKVLDVNPPPKKIEQKVEYQKCDITEYEEVKRGLEDEDLVIHAAIVQIPLINEAKKLGYEVNLLGTQNICQVVNEAPSIKGLILCGSWHVFGEKGWKGIIDEEFGFRPDKVEERARLYTLSKIAQEVIVRFYDEMSEKIYGVIRMGTVLGEGMPEKTAANIFISNGLKGESITPYKHSMYRPMLYVDVKDVCQAFEVYAKKILNGAIHKNKNSVDHIVNVYWPKFITIIELASIIRDTIVKFTGEKVKPKIEIVDKGVPVLHTAKRNGKVKIDVRKVRSLLGIKNLTPPQESIERIVKARISRTALIVGEL